MGDKIQQARLSASLAIAAWYTLLFVIFVVVRPELAYTYGHWLHDFGHDLPRLTIELSLPVLGPAFSSATQAYSPVFWLAWSFVLLPPLLLLKRVWRAPDRLSLLESMLYAGLTYGMGVVVLCILVVLGLWLPFSAA